jgi:hypothetical protein
VKHRHLLPEEIDLLLDGEEGFGVAPLRNHLAECPTCQTQYRALAAVVGGLESLPLLAPSPVFADRVLQQVQVFEPWHVALRDTVKRWMPQSSIGRVFAGATGGVMAVALTFVAVWLGQRADAVLFLANLGLQRTRDGLTDMAHSVALSLFGNSAASALQSGGAVAVLAATGAMVAAVLAVAFGVKSLATASRRRRS